MFVPVPHPQSPISGPWIGRGQCIEHYGAGEPYLPIFEALGRLCREPEGRRLIDILGVHAPTWLVQMPSLLKAAELERLQRTVQGATRERMLREMAEALEVASGERLLILVLEDLHWSDYSTLELLAVLARRRDRARLLVLATYRPADVAITGSPLRRVLDELQLHGDSNTLALSFLTRSNVATGLIYRGWALAACGEVNEGITQIRAGLEAVEQTGAILARPYYLALLSEAYGEAGQLELALQALEQALTLAHTNDERCYEAELWRLKGQLLLNDER